MPLTYNQYTGNGSTKQYTLSFPYISKDHVFVRVGGENVAFTWLNDTTVVLASAPASGAKVMVYRNTPKDGYLVTFKAGTGFREKDLNTMNTQILYVVQENFENVDVDDLYTWRTEAMEARDAAVLAKNDAITVKDTAVSASATAVTAKDTAVTAKDTAVSASETAVSARDTAVSAKDTAVSAQNAAVTALITAENAAGNASASEATASAKALEATIAASTATAAADSASADAVLADASAKLAFGASAPAWDPLVTYNYPDVVAYTDGHTYRCTGENISGYEQAPGIGPYNWQKVSVEGGRQFFEHDENGDYQPKLDPFDHDGVDGNTILTGYGPPTTGQGKPGDCYINRATWDFYEKTSNDTWEVTGNIKGEGGGASQTTTVVTHPTEEDVWTVIHYLGRYPAITIMNDLGEQILGEITYISADAFMVSFSEPVKGTLYLN